MSTVVLHVGQCGNQLGLEWWKLIANYPSQGKDTNRCPFSSRDGRFAAVFVDSEPKALWGTRQFLKDKRILNSSIVQTQGGSGSNWAYGLGSKLCEEIRGTFPAGHILTASVAPHQSGESPLQNSNSLLSLALLHRSADGVLLFHNDQALAFAQTRRGRPASAASLCAVPAPPSLSVMNAHIASCMAGLLLPARSLNPTSGPRLDSEAWELIRSVCPMPAAKLLHTTQACASEKTKWDVLARSTLQAVPQLSSTGKSYSSCAVFAVARANKDDLLSTALQRLKKGHRCVSWNPFPVDHWTDPNNTLEDSPSPQLLTVCSNHSSVASLLDHVVQRSKEMLQARAYCHWYQRYGVEESDFQQALETCSAVIQEYSHQ